MKWSQVLACLLATYVAESGADFDPADLPVPGGGGASRRDLRDTSKSSAKFDPADIPMPGGGGMNRRDLRDTSRQPARLRRMNEHARPISRHGGEDDNVSFLQKKKRPTRKLSMDEFEDIFG